MGGGYSPSRGGWDGGGGGGSPLETYDLVSQREGKQQEVDQLLSVMRDVQNQYGFNLDTEVAKMPAGSNAFAYYSYNMFEPDKGNVGVNQTYFNSQKIQNAYDDTVRLNFHPARGDKSAMEAVIAHEMGHAVTGQIAGKRGKGLEDISNKIITDARKKDPNNNRKLRNSDYAGKVSRYSMKNPAEAVAEAFADVYCNGNKAKSASRYIVDTLNEYYGG